MWNPIVGDSVVGGGYLSPIVNNENFGVQAVRQIVDAAKTMGDSPAKLVEALVIARSNNLPDVAAALEKKLGVSKEEATPAGTGKELL
jgi:microcompartment protein CcmL/EutN